MYTTLVSLILAAWLNGVTVPAEQMNFYADTFVITKTDEANDEFYLINFSGTEKKLKGIEDLFVGDYISAIMCDNGTPNDRNDDVICSWRYSGWLNGDFGIDTNGNYLINVTD